MRQITSVFYMQLRLTGSCWLQTRTFGTVAYSFMAPEAIDVQKWRDAITGKSFSSRVVTVVIDEAHCVSKWYAILIL